MKEGWEVKKLGDVTFFKSGTTIKKDLEKTIGEVLYIKVGDMNLEGNKKELTTSTRFVNYGDIKESQIIPIGSVVFPKRGGAIATNKKRIIIKPTIIDLNTMAITPKEEISMDYFFYWFKTVDLVSISSGTSIPQINNYSFDNMFISFPKSLPEQKQIVKTLDLAFGQIDQAKANLEQNLANAKELFASKLNGVFSQRGEGWEEKRLEDICTKITDGVHKKPDYKESGVPFIKIKNLTEGNTISFSDVSYISEEDHIEYSKRTNPEKGDILITKDGTIGVVRVIETDIIFSIFVSLALIKPLDKKITFYLKYVLISPIIQNQIKPKGTALKHLYLKDLRKFIIPIPSIEIQNNIVKKLDKLAKETETLQTHYQQNLNNLEELKKSILEKAFKGEL